MKTAVLEGYNCSLAATCISRAAALRTDVSILLLKWIIIHTLFFSNMLLHLTVYSNFQPRSGGQRNKTKKVSVCTRCVPILP